jgi:hypothetical protein
MNDYIFSTKQQNRPEPAIEFYTLAGNEDYYDNNQLPRLNVDSDKTYAKKTIRDDGTIRYSIRLSLSNKLYDPTSAYGLDKTKSFLDNTVRNENRFKNVNVAVFDWYLNFLKTKNTAWLNNAQREDE